MEAGPLKGSCMETVILNVKGMTCMGCAQSVKKALQPMDGVKRVDISLEKAEVAVDYDPEQVQPAQLKSAIEGAGYEVATRE